MSPSQPFSPRIMNSKEGGREHFWLAGLTPYLMEFITNKVGAHSCKGSQSPSFLSFCLSPSPCLQFHPSLLYILATLVRFEELLL